MPERMLSWHDRTPIQRALLAAAAGLLLAALLYALVRPALSARAELGTQLPRLRAEVENLRMQAAEIAVLRKRPSIASAPPDLQGTLRAALAASPLAASLLERRQAEADRFSVSGEAVRFEHWLAWVTAVHQQHGIRLEGCRVSAVRPGIVRVDATFTSSPVAASTR